MARKKTVYLKCNGERHRVKVAADGSLTFLDCNVKAGEVAQEFGADPGGTCEWLDRVWRSLSCDRSEMPMQLREAFRTWLDQHPWDPDAHPLPVLVDGWFILYTKVGHSILKSNLNPRARPVAYLIEPDGTKTPMYHRSQLKRKPGYIKYPWTPRATPKDGA